ncbi:hypothetical protein BaRGS_00031033 [Batillaria attramentaria]|uniref:Uncharacterized protein n=1 Tax=Batillaria attramentaria TaxID=370345 RepID=A0ABD0JSY2_9CAEN
MSPITTPTGHHPHPSAPPPFDTPPSPSPNRPLTYPINPTPPPPFPPFLSVAPAGTSFGSRVDPYRRLIGLSTDSSMAANVSVVTD